MPKTKQYQYISELVSLDPKDANELSDYLKKLSKKYQIPIPTRASILAIVKQNQLAPRSQLNELLKKRAVRTLSGIAPVAVLTKPYPCPGRCAYCPSQKEIPRSYLSNEPAVMRAIRCKFNPYKQVYDRLKALEANGHHPEKIELIVIGGTWSYLPTNYKYWYIKECFRAANDFDGKTKPKSNSNKDINGQKRTLSDLKKQLIKEQTKNESAKYHLIGITLETRPDYINTTELLEMRQLGCTRVEIGVQALDDKILKYNHRDSSVTDIIRATKLLKDWGFKVTYHFMPELPSSNVKRDFEMFQDMFTPLKSIKIENYNGNKILNTKKILASQIPNNNFNPDQIKFYPTVVTKGSLLYKWWRDGKYQPYSDQELQDLIINCKAIIPPYVRIIRLIRDIPGESIEAGNRITNLRQIMQDKGLKCNCIRCREPRNKSLKNPNLFITKYRASESDEYFISFENKDRSVIYGFLRLRLNESDGPFKLKTAIIRELHVYGLLTPINNKGDVQHQGLGKKMIAIATILSQEAGYHNLAVISGVGVRQYYRSLGFKLNHSYLTKAI